MIGIIIASIAVIALVIASITDIKTREVPDWLNYSLIVTGIGIRLIYSLINNEWMFLVSGLAGLGVFIVIAYIMFYAGQWGGGDSKLLMGLGALIGLRFTLNNELTAFMVNLLIVGAVYGLLYSLVLVLINRKRFLRELKKHLHSIARTRKIMMILFLILVLASAIMQNLYLRLLIIALIVVVYSSFYLIMLVKIVEKACMLKYVKPSELTEGEWIAKDIIINKKRITGPKDLGIEKKQIKQLINFYKKGKIKKVLIKIGMPFVPSFLVAYILSLFFGNLLLMFLF
ncbi:MAG: prepilin peptidase [Nanoarchaeota archaeon]|nr:prepilin peptidase [Nanoarchaeota archaeon]